MMAESTGGKIYTFTSDPGSIADSLTNVTTELIERPVVIFSSSNYFAKPGEIVRFDVSSSYVVESSIQSYDWDFNGDGIWDQTTSDPSVEYAYETPYIGLVHARANTTSGMVGTMTASVEVSDADIHPIITPPPAHDVVAAEQNINSEVLVSWVRESHPSDYLVSVNGVTIGRVSRDAESITVTDLDRTQDVIIGVRSIDESGAVSEEVGATLAAIIPEEPTPEITPPAEPVDNNLPPPATPGAITKEPTVESENNDRRAPAILARASDVLLAYNSAPPNSPEIDQEQGVTPKQPATNNQVGEVPIAEIAPASSTPTWITPAAIVTGAAIALIGYRWIRRKG
jgi:PKD repeat protein